MKEKELLEKAQNVVVIGSTQNKEKYGYKIYKKLKELNKNVVGISPIYKEIDGERTYLHLKDVPFEIDLAVFVVHPKHGIAYVEECAELKIQEIWLQPGTYDDAFLERINERGLYAHKACVLVVANYIKEG